MTCQSALPWWKIQDYLVELSSQNSIHELCTTSLQNIYQLIPFDISVDILNSTGSLCYDLPANSRKKWIGSYNQYFYTCNPALQLDLSSLKGLDWREFHHTEFVTDFINPQGIRYTLAVFSLTSPISINIHRSPKSPNFTDLDYNILQIITPHFNNIYSYLTKISKLEAINLQTVELARGCKLLSKREAEVAALLYQRLTMVEIATKLMVSPRTIQTHVERIKEKLRVRNRRELMLKLAGKPEEKHQG